MAREHSRERQIDRACSAQSPEMLPKDDDDLTEEERGEIKVKQIEQAIDKFF